MAYEDAPGSGDWTNSLDVDHRYVTEINVFGAIGDTEELPCEYHAAVSHDYERPASGHPLATPSDGERPWLGNRLLSGPWDPFASQGRMEDQSMLDLPARRHDQQSLSQCWPGGSVESAPSWLDGRGSGHAATSAEAASWPYYNGISE
jgi:hypothetical protein